MVLFDRSLDRGPPLCIAEIGAGHNGLLGKALELIATAKRAGAAAVKIQAYEPDALTIRCNRPEFISRNPLWHNRTLYDLYSEAYTPYRWLPDLFGYARKIGLPLFASVFDPIGLQCLKPIDPPAYKIASFELVDLPLLGLVAAEHKPVILSTGMASDVEICDAVNAVRGCPTILLACTSGYPCPASEANLQRMAALRKIVPHVGLSDHTLGINVPVAATALGACMIEKHMRLSYSDIGTDAAFSLTAAEFGTMVHAVEDAWAACQPSEPKSEEPQRAFRRSLYVVEDMKQGEPFTMQNVRSIRPANGLPPKMFNCILKYRAAKDIEAGTALSLAHLGVQGD
jgi:N-acetylneuraminate synthase